MKGGKRPHGYTIVEVLLFVIISGVMFLVAAVFISGKQAHVEFQQSMQDINTQVRNVANEVGNGEFPALNGFNCNAGGASAPTFNRGVSGQGSNGGCIFLGKVFQFNVGGLPSSNYNVYSIAARQVDATTGDAVTSFSGAKPVPAIAFGQGLDTTVKNQLHNGLVTTKVLECNPGGGCANIGAFGFFGSLGGTCSSSQLSDQQSAAQSVCTVVVPNTVAATSETGMAASLTSNLRAITPGNMVTGGKYILLCFQNGSRKASVTIGGTSGQQFTTTLKMSGGTTC